MIFPAVTVLAVDPGPTKSAWVLWKGDTLVAFGMDANEKLLERCGRLAADSHVDVFALEKVVSYGMAVGAEVSKDVWAALALAVCTADTRVPKP